MSLINPRNAVQNIRVCEVIPATTGILNDGFKAMQRQGSFTATFYKLIYLDNARPGDYHEGGEVFSFQKKPEPERIEFKWIGSMQKNRKNAALV